MSGAGGRGGELVPVVVASSEEGLGFSLMLGGLSGRMALVKRVWDRQLCSGLQPGDAIVKINGADVQSLSLTQVQSQQSALFFSKLAPAWLCLYAHD